jgi:hypothetical protein
MKLVFRCSLLLGALLSASACGFIVLDTKWASRTSIDRFDSISLERTACYGACPVYKVTVWGDRRVDYEGKEFVKTAGHQAATLSQGQLAELARAFSDADFLSLRDKYMSSEDGCPAVATDSPSAITTLELGRQEKTIRHYYGCGERGGIYPRALTELETRIDEIVGTDRWIGTRDERSRLER